MTGAREGEAEIVPSPVCNRMAEITGAVVDGFDIRVEADPDTAVIPIEEDAGWKGFALVQVRPNREGGTRDNASVKALVLQERSEESFSRAIDRVEAYCAQEGFSRVAIPVNLENAPVSMRGCSRKATGWHDWRSGWSSVRWSTP